MLSQRSYTVATAVIALAGATLVAAPQASADITLIPPLAPYAAFYQSPAGTLAGYATNYGLIDNNVALAPGTSPSTAPTAASFQMVWHGANGDLWSSGPNGPIDLGLAMAPGTNPSLLTFPDGNWIVAVNNAAGQLQTTGSWGLGAQSGLTMAPGTSPSIASIPDTGRLGPIADNFMFAWQGTNNHLFVSAPTATGGLDTGNAMAPGTSPSLYSYPDINGGYIAAFQAGDGNLGWSNNADDNGTFGTNLAMAPGTSPSVVDPVSGSDIPTIAVQGRNGDLWTYGSDTFAADPAPGDDTGLPMMAGTSPSMIVTPFDLPGKPHGGLTFYAGYTSNTGAVSVYGLETIDNSTAVIAESTGQVAAPGTSPSIVSALNWVDGKQVVFAGETGANWQQFFTPSTAGTTAVPVKPTSKPTITPMLDQPAASSTCPTVRAQLQQYAAENIKQVLCETVTPAAAPTSAPGTKAAATPDSAASGSCNPLQWTISRGEECSQALVDFWTVINPETFAIVGTLTFLDSQDILLSNYSSLFTENDTYSLIAETGNATGVPATVSFAANCSSPCKLAGNPPPSVFNLAENTSKSFSYTFQDSPGVATPDTFNLSYSFNISLPPPVFAPSLGPYTWSAPQPIRCDNNTPNYTAAGCVVPTYVPDLVLPQSVYGAAAVNAYVGELYLPGTPGLTAATPLTRGNPATSDANRNVTCSGFTALPAGNIYAVVNDSCDEYPFASSQQSGGALGIAGGNCLEIVPTQAANGNWTFKFRNMYTAVYPQVCLRGHVNSAQNSAVGTALQSMYVGNRMMIGDPYTVQVTN